MQMTIQTQGFPMSSSVYRRARGQLERALGSFRESIVDLDVFLKDINGPKGGFDKAVVVRVNLTTQQSVTVETVSSNLHAAIILSARRAKRSVRRAIEKRRRVGRQELRDWRGRSGRETANGSPVIEEGWASSSAT